ncbi:MAG: putative transporter [Firmicutes bacterium]|nr:putative transporter [candidate division NPL-UPA2 bacterium]
MNDQVLAVLVFAVTFFLFILNRDRGLLYVWVGSLVLLVLGVITARDAWQALNWNVLGIFFGTMILAELFVLSQAPAFLATKMVNAAGSAPVALLAIVAFAGALSSFIENVAAVFIAAPLAFETAKRVKVSPVPVLIAVATASNLQGVATMIGDSPSMMLATAAHMTFADFFWMQGRPGIFFAVQLGAIAVGGILYLFFRDAQGRAGKRPAPKVFSWTPSLLIVLLVLTLAASSFIPDRPDALPGLITASFGVLALLWNSRRELFTMELTKLDWQTFFLLAGLFVLISGLSVSGVVATVADYMSAFAGESVLTAFVMIVLVSVAVSAIVDNIPYTIAMLPVTQLLAERMGVNPLPLLFALVLSTSLGGNITPIGASANVVAVGMLKRQGYSVSFFEFFRIGFPVTVTAVTLGALFIWFVWM